MNEMTTEQKLLQIYARDKHKLTIKEMSEILPHLEYIRNEQPLLWERFLRIMRELKLILCERDFDNRQSEINWNEEQSKIEEQ